ncbi:alpha/beta fold hydrolase [Actinoalloteichus hymeniacidonis]|uniref:Hydrolase or acyltransferase of alpha/beta superfamily n=1 Tax=Actinoalloteichus hymeniacidonis TaxID=340345 RepID=A0AAC9HRN8_9PSEU|nr:alpha/beta fold hydrolase [Actinoalloteichus hymeniacidonis]AOS64104.1 putative hydrolase or acyltransferase of alpha/beta superfamily [Actinoalloteichus hymeniacidonis]MBB5907832.1 pimeloyl-ACP methyl ester carboxylesterase [Actinoalloteichus hymeniacidonis]
MSAPARVDRLIPNGAREEFLAVDGGRVRLLRSTTSGDGVPMLLIHGGGSDNAAISWNLLFEPLSRDRPVIALDLPGFGYTEGLPITGTAQGMARQADRVLEVLGIERAIVVGVSMGGEVALRFALHHPDSTAAAVAIAPGGLIEVYRNPLAHRIAWLGTTLPDAVLLPLSSVANRFTRSVIRHMVHDIETLPAPVVDEMVREARRPRAGYAYGRYTKAAIGSKRMHNNLLPSVARIAAPTLLFHGSQDSLVDPEGSRAAAKLMSDARLVMVPDCGHWAQIEKHERFCAELAAFLAQHHID